MKNPALPEQKWCEVMLGNKPGVLHYYTEADLLAYGEAVRKWAADAAAIAILEGCAQAIKNLPAQQGAAP